MRQTVCEAFPRVAFCANVELFMVEVICVCVDMSDMAFIPYLSNHAAEQNVLNHIFTARKTWRIGQTNSRGNTERPRKKAFKGSDKAIHIQRKEGVREVVYEMINIPANQLVSLYLNSSLRVSQSESIAGPRARASKEIL